MPENGHCGRDDTLGAGDQVTAERAGEESAAWLPDFTVATFGWRVRCC